MYPKFFLFLRRALALLLAAALFATLPALGEEEPLTLDDAPELSLPETDELLLDDAPEFSEDPELIGDIGLTDDLELDLDLDLGDGTTLDPDEGEANNNVDNDSRPIPEYTPKTHTLKLQKSQSYTIGNKDKLVLVAPKGNIASWKNSNSKVAGIARDANSKSKLNVSPLAVGSTKITVTLDKGRKYTINLTVNDPTALKKLSFDDKTVTLYTGMDIDLHQHYTIQPATALANISFSSSNNAVARLSKDYILTGMKEGKAVVTATAGNGIKATMNVTVKENSTGALHGKPTKAAAKKLGGKWTLWPRSVEMLGDGSIACRLWVVNGTTGKMTGLKNVDLGITRKDKHGGELIARTALESIKVSCDDKSWQTLTVTFPVKAVYCSGLNFTKLAARDLAFQLYGTPKAEFGNGKDAAYHADGIPADKKSSGAKAAKYRALLISETDFYWPQEKDPAKKKERSFRNRVDVIAFQNMLQHVQTPDGGTYSITTQNNTSKKQLKNLIKKTFAKATENDVSLFFIATHGDSSNKASDRNSGALIMSPGDNKYEELTLEELRDCLIKVPGKVIVILESCGSGAAVHQKVRSNSGMDSLARAAETFDANAVEAFRSVDPGVVDGGLAANTGEFRVVNKFYVLTSCNYHEECYGIPAYDFFSAWLIAGVGKSGNMPADQKYAGNNNGMVDLHELYRYISQVGDRNKIKYKGANYYQHVQVYPSDVRFPLFK